jgi:hypothetical protein
MRDAIIVVHGMGDQVRFQSTDVIVYGLGQHPGVVQVNASTVQVEDQSEVQRAEVQMQGDPNRTLDVYEAYWAPITEGNVTVWDSVQFLTRGGLNGIRNGTRTFYRWLFQRAVPFDVPLTSTLGIAVVLLALASLLLFNFVAAGVVIRGWWKNGNTEIVLRDLITVIGLVVHNLIAFALVLLASWLAKASPGTSRTRHRVARFFGAIAYPAMLGVLIAAILCAIGLLMVAIRHNGPAARAILALSVPPVLLGSVIVIGLGWAIGRFARNGRFKALGRAVSALGALALVAGLFLSLSQLLLPYLAIHQPVADCYRRAGVEAPDPGAPAGLFTVLFACGVSAGAGPYQIWFLIALAIYGLAVFACYRAQRPVMGAAPSPIWLAMVILCSAAFPFVTYFIAATINGALLRMTGRPLELTASIHLLPWLGVVAAGYVARDWLIKYVGDVAAYVSSHKLDKFDEVRREIKTTVEEVFRTVYLLKEGNQPAYRQVGVVAHSLGSVIAFDAVNAMLLEEELRPEDAMFVRDRTTLLLTFGSPLDKVAYVYATITAATRMTREKLVGAAKPLTSDPASRRDLAWINLWSPNDVISGALEYYDDPQAAAPPRILNVRDPHATTPIVAHGEYYEHPLLFDLIATWHAL